MTKLISIVLAVVVVCVAVPLLSAAALHNAGGGADCVPAATPTTSTLSASTGDWDAEQRANVGTITRVGNTKRVPPWGWVVAVATAIQESGLRNLPSGDRDSIGLFQQRPSQGWGTATQLADPAYQAGKFFDRLLTIDGWQRMPLTAAADAVQRSAYPDAYATHETAAVALVSAVADVSAEQLLFCGGSAGEWTQPVRGIIGSGFRTVSRPGHDGVDLIATHGTPIRAASAGTVERVRCNAIRKSDNTNWGCDRDGDPELVKGCGWYTDIRHGHGIITRYCHMQSRPTLEVGETVVAGQPIGKVGSSGNSSGAHLHFEVHVNGDHGAGGAIDPVPFMDQKGAPLVKTGMLRQPRHRALHRPPVRLGGTGAAA